MRFESFPLLKIGFKMSSAKWLTHWGPNKFDCSLQIFESAFSLKILISWLRIVKFVYDIILVWPPKTHTRDSSALDAFWWHAPNERHIYLYRTFNNFRETLLDSLNTLLDTLCGKTGVRMCSGVPKKCGLCAHLTHWGRDKMATFFQTAFSNAFSWMKMSEFRLKYHWSLFLYI